MPILRPPTQDYLQMGGTDHPLWQHFDTIKGGVTVYKDIPDVAASEINRVSGVVTVSVDEGHGKHVGDTVTVVSTNLPDFNGTFTVTAIVSDFIFRYADARSDLSGGVGFVAHWIAQSFPYHGGAEFRTYDGESFIMTSDIGLATAVEVYLGGSEFLITEDKRTELVAAGFGSSVFYDSYMSITGINSYWSTPDHSSLNVDNLDVRILAESAVVDWIPLFLSNHIVSKGSSTSWVVSIHPNGRCRTAIYPEAGEPFSLSDEVGPALGFGANKPHWFRSVVKFFPANMKREFRIFNSPDGKDWYQMGRANLEDTIKTKLTNVVDPLFVPGSAGGLSWLSKIYYMELRSDVDGSIVANPDWRNVKPGTTSITDSTGKLWTSTGANVPIVGI